MKKFTCFTCVCFALFFGQKARAQDGDGVLNEIKNLKANMNAVLANQTAAKRADRRTETRCRRIGNPCSRL